MLKNCPECQLPVSDKAVSCPHCGYPFKDISQKSSPRKKSKKRRRLPNGFGQITEIKNKNLRKPFRVMVTVGKNEYGKPICKLLKPEAYFSTYNEAYSTLIEYNKSPYDLDSSMSMDDLFTRWSEKYYAGPKNEKSLKDAKNLWTYCSPIWEMPANLVRIKDLRSTIESASANRKEGIKQASDRTKTRIKSMFNLMYDYAVEYEIVEKNYAREFTLSKQITENIADVDNEHLAFSDEEIKSLWENINNSTVKKIVIQLYGGWRPSELLELEVKNINLIDRTIKGGMKTPSGEDRIVPIHEYINELVNEQILIAKEKGSSWLFPNKKDPKKHETYFQYRNSFNNVIKELRLNPNHRAHDPRKTFVTLAKKSGMDDYALKRIIGHKITDITERVYTVRSIDWLKEEMKKIR